MIFNRLRFLIFVSMALLGLSAQAQQAKVIKVQGKKAIVQFPDDARPRVGQLIDLGGSSEISMGAGHGGGARDIIVGGSASLSTLSSSGSSGSSTLMDLSGRYGLNVGEMEYGGIGSFYYYAPAGTTTRTFGFGGFFDYNLVPNRPGVELVYGGGAELHYLMTAYTIGSAQTNTNSLRFQGGGQMKWFPFGNTVAVRGDLMYRFQQDSSTTSSTTSGLVALGGLYVYF